MSLLLPLVAALVPILALPHILFYFDVTPKVAALLAGAAVACCLFRTNTGSLRAFARGQWGRRVLVLFAAFALSLAISTATSSNSALSLSGGNWRRFGLITQLAAITFVLLATAQASFDRAILRRTCRAIAVTGSVIGIYTTLQYFGWDPLFPSAAYHVGEGIWTIVRPPGTLGHANYLGTYLIMVVFLGGSLFWSDQQRAWKLAGFCAAAIGSFAIVLSGARSAILGALAGAVFLILRMRPRARVVLAGVAASLVALAMFYYSPAGQKLRGRTRWYREDPIGGARLLLWRDTLRMARDRAAAGWGLETFSTEFPRYQSIELARAYPDFYHESPHNIFLDELAARGALGLLPFVVFTGLAAWASFSRRRPPDTALAAAFIAALVSLQFNAFVLTTAFFFYLTAALLIAGYSDPLPLAPEALTWKRRMPAAIAGVPLAVVFVIFAARLCAADFALARVKRLIDTGDPYAASARYSEVLRWQPPGAGSDLFYSRSMSTLIRRQRELIPAVKAWQESVQAGIRATGNAEDRHNAFYNLASLYATVNNPVDAERSLRGAINAAPNWFKPHWMLAQVLKLRGKPDEAWWEAKAALERGGDKHPEVLETLRDLGTAR